MLHGGAEHDGALVLHIVQPGIHNELVALGHADFHVQIADVVLDAVEAHLSHVDVGMDSDATDRYQGPNLHGRLNVQLVRRILEDLQDVDVIRTFRRSGQPKGELRLEIGQNLLICICGCVMGLVDDQVIIVILPELIQIQSDALDAAAHHVVVGLLEVVCIFADACLRP